MAIMAGCGAITQEVVLHDSRVDSNYMAQPDSSKILYFTGLTDNRAEKTNIGYEMNSKGEHTVIVKSRNDAWASLSQGTSFSEDLCPQESNRVVILQGKRSKYAITQMLDSIRKDMSSFYRNRQKENTGFLGSMCLRLMIEPDGRVSTLNAIVSSDDGEFSHEAQKRFSAIDFGNRSSDTVPTEYCIL